MCLVLSPGEVSEGEGNRQGVEAVSFFVVGRVLAPAMSYDNRGTSFI